MMARAGWGIVLIRENTHNTMVKTYVPADKPSQPSQHAAATSFKNLFGIKAGSCETISDSPDSDLEPGAKKTKS